MPVTIKSEREINLMREAGKILAKVHEQLAQEVKAGMSSYEIDKICEEIIRSYDCIPSFLVRKHTIEDFLAGIPESFRRLVSHFDPIRGFDSYFCRHLGVITHYVADYFTFPHNQNFPGNLKDHCIYEEELKKELRSYVREPGVERGRLSESVHTPEAILGFVQRMHQIYMRMQSGVKRDCEYILELCHTVVDALLILCEELTKNMHLSLVSL